MRESTSIRKVLRFDSVAWSKVLDLLVSKYHIPFFHALDELQGFFKKSETFFALAWVVRPSLNPREHLIACILCDLNGADRVTLVHQRSLTALRLTLLHELELRPILRTARDLPTDHGSATVQLRVRCGKRDWVLRSPLALVSFYLGLGFLFALLLLAVMMVIAYGTAVFIVLLSNPLATTGFALRNGVAGLALLIFLMFCAAVIGRATKNILGGLLRLFSRSGSD